MELEWKIYTVTAKNLPPLAIGYDSIPTPGLPDYRPIAYFYEEDHAEFIKETLSKNCTVNDWLQWTRKRMEVK